MFIILVQLGTCNIEEVDCGPSMEQIHEVISTRWSLGVGVGKLVRVGSSGSGGRPWNIDC